MSRIFSILLQSTSSYLPCDRCPHCPPSSLWSFSYHQCSMNSSFGFDNRQNMLRPFCYCFPTVVLWYWCCFVFWSQFCTTCILWHNAFACRNYNICSLSSCSFEMTSIHHNRCQLRMRPLSPRFLLFTVVFHSLFEQISFLFQSTAYLHNPIM